MKRVFLWLGGLEIGADLEDFTGGDIWVLTGAKQPVDGKKIPERG